MRAFVIGVTVALLTASPAMAECSGLAEIEARIGEVWPGAKYSIYEAQDSAAIEDGLASAGGTVPPADRVFVVIDLPDTEKLRIVGIKEGCYEDFVDVDRATLDAWLAGEAG